MLQRHVQVRQQQAVGHQRDQRVHVRVGVHVMQAHPHAQLAQRAGQRQQVGAQRPTAVKAGAVFDVHAVGAGVLRDHQQLAHAGIDQRLGLGEHLADRPADQVAAQGRDDAEAAAVVAALGNLQVGVVRRRQAQALRRQQVDIGIVLARGRRRQVLLYRGDDLGVGMGSGHRQHARVAIQNLAGVGAQAAGDDDLAVLGQRLADGVERLLPGLVDEAAGVDHHQIRAGVAVGQRIAAAAQLGQDAFGIHQRLGTAKADKTDLGGGHAAGVRNAGGGDSIPAPRPVSMVCRSSPCRVMEHSLRKAGQSLPVRC